MIERLLAFDRDGDGKVARNELPERMQGLILLGDRDGDGAPERDEIKRMSGRQRVPGGPGAPPPPPNKDGAPK